MFPTWGKPIPVFVVVALILPGPSIFSHMFGLGAGYLMAMGYLRFMIEPPSKVVLFIENKIAFLIDLIPSEIRYIKEVEAIELRKNAFSGMNSTELPLYEVPAFNPSNSNDTEEK